MKIGERELPYELIWEDRGLFTRFWDTVTDDEYVKSHLDGYSDPRFESIEYALDIFSDSMVFEVTGAAVRRMAEMDVGASKRNPKVLVVIVATQTVMRGVTNQFHLQHELMGGTWKPVYFETEEEARRWLAETLD